MGIQNKV